LIALLALAWYLRRRAPLSSFGILVFLLLIAPTSSVVPIKDTLVERRLYLPFLGLLLIAVDVLRHWKLGKLQLTGVLSAIVALLCVLTYQRNQVWSDPISLWQDTADKSPRKSRPRFQLAFARYSANQCGQAAQEYEKVSALEPPDSALLVNWALAYQCSQQYGPAIEKLELALKQEKTAHVYSLIGMIRAQQGLTKESWNALNEAVRVDANYPMSYVYRGNLNVAAGDLAAAQAEYHKALAINPKLPAAQEALAKLQLEMRSAPAPKQP
jgi:tetratricopeptide (TPR) repeat protein